MNDESVAKFAQNLRGPVIGRDHPEYEEARKLYNAMIDKRPLLIARCADVADIIAAVNFGRENRLPIAIRGGGHNGPGLASVNDGLVVDLSTMKGVRVDPRNKTVRVGAGCTTGDVDHATHAFGQAVPFGVVSDLPWTICLRRTWCWRTAVSSLRQRLRTRICCGPCAAEAETSAS